MPRHKNTYATSDPLRVGGCAPWEVIVPVDELAEVLVPALERFNLELDTGHSNRNGDKNGAMAIVAERSAETLGIRVESIPRRLWGIRQREFRTCNVRHADAFLLALDVYIEDYPITHLPQGMAAAQEMVDAYHAEQGLRPRRKDAEALAAKLLRFKHGFINEDKLIARAETGTYVPPRKLEVAA